ncbi:hypothetical protein C8J57DRAFT_1636967 [Mycena rebaudengoi]|nr:hypothetical protein C8J57DRAFT_1636967 [Mycena rebaudengoi]
MVKIWSAIRRKGFDSPQRPKGDVAIDVCLSWIVPTLRSDLALATIFVALPEFAWLEHIEYLWLRDWCTIPAALWQLFLGRLAGLQTLDRLPARRPFLGARAPPRDSSPATLPGSYFDLDNTRFLELLICYLELRAAPLARLVMRECFGYTGAEVKLLRRLVGSVLWDGWGMDEGVYQANGDYVGALTINHTLIARQKGYEELNLSEADRWHEDSTLYLEVRPSTRMSDRLYGSYADYEVEEKILALAGWRRQPKVDRGPDIRAAILPRTSSTENKMVWLGRRVEFSFTSVFSESFIHYVHNTLQRYP